MRPTRPILLLVLLAVVLAAFLLKPVIQSALSPVTNKMTNRKTVADRLAEFGGAARGRLRPHFAAAGVPYPPAGVKLAAIKAERLLEVYATDSAGSNHWIRSYPILAASGGPGPKLREGDGQVPEGIYPIESLNPNSLYHVSLRVGYPNDFDRAMAAKDGRTDLGGDIMIHGKNVSIGCLAMGDAAAEDLFVLAAETGLGNLKVIIAPVDFRAGQAVPQTAGVPGWCGELYPRIKQELAQLPPEPHP
jgi:hypothetical protein